MCVLLLCCAVVVSVRELVKDLLRLLLTHNLLLVCVFVCVCVRVCIYAMYIYICVCVSRMCTTMSRNCGQREENIFSIFGTYTHICAKTYTYTRTNTRTRGGGFTHTHTHTHTHTQTHIETCAHVDRKLCTYACRQIDSIHALIRTHKSTVKCKRYITGTIVDKV